MKLLIILGSILIPIAMFVVQKVWMKWRIYFNVVAVMSTVIFGEIAALAIYEILKDNTVFMTHIHAIFLNPLFLITGAYLGIYFLYRLMCLLYEERELH
ncbi:transposase [Paenibacillus antarcticus]|uniref:Transposase n=1 Tax=Paenibacillus antarcticus TaxID=253703 RepID=A0A162K6E8_9BACL|nr:transposase [Paenibacillus antarcticus]OAB43686.1 transposase [Paenibacillus antarcticus]